ncbi:outer membrane lipoprotein carrier protein LolA [Pseudoalteromonas sp. KG3]|uniref:Outer membrane lipoprotein carrier protein LolA n=1 Tax=Pseudoalteromonas prydzensis TaxID=182141 RepID=A0ABR9FL73_9GAMM|nr:MULTISPECIES: outer membrane lipoprotein carrier protein LolA [Pseudoalteromonas]MBE0457537.1 outer membrane lipoprotein carrier protein LolA [Pseudoalteromonas prydzensis]WKD26126.1 outer membrane lipoprotein carrier protein LolA [Pseudoalteromonas sp. KG3]
MWHKMMIVLLVLTLLLSSQASAHDFSRFKVVQAKGQFSQAKQFTFLKRAIKSQGEFVIYGQHVYWHTLTPVSSEMLLLPTGIYSRLQSQQQYQIVTQEKQFNQLLAKLLSGNIDNSDWQISLLDPQCYQLIPVLPEIANLFTKVKLCASDDSQRNIVITDQQNNQTEITMQITSKELNQGDMDAVKLND